MPIYLKIISLFVVTVMLLGTACGCSDKNPSIDSVNQYVKSESDDSWDDVTDTVKLENENLLFTLEAETSHFHIENKKTGDVFYSVPQEETSFISDEVSQRLTSEITLEYYGEQTDKLFLYSSDISGSENLSVKTNGNSVRVSYKMGDGDGFVPALFDEESFEVLLKKLENDALRRRFKRYYNLTSAKEKTGEYKENLEKYPILKKKKLYILNSLATDIDKSDIMTYLQDVGYSFETYKSMLDKLEITDTDIKKNAGFTVCVEYSLNGDGFSATVLNDRIKENSEEYKLQKINLLEYFSSVLSNDGSFLVPDGSGALISFGSAKNFSQSYYGDDYAVNQDKKKDIGYNLSLPVFGMSCAGKGMFAVIEGAAEVAELNVGPKNSSNPLNHIFTSFAVRNIDVTDYGASMQVPIYNLFSKDIISVSPKIRYFLLDSNNNSYSSMAKIYSSYLTGNGTFSNKCQTIPTYMDFLCMITEKANFLGVSYTKKTVLSTLDDIKNTVEQLEKAGIGPIVVRLFGYTSSGYEHSVYSKFQLDKKVGTYKQLAQLNEMLVSHGGMLCLDSDIQFAFHKGNGFNPSKDSARYLNRLVVCRGSYDIVSREYSDELRRYMISPINYEKYANGFIKGLKAKWNGKVLPGLSYSSSGNILGGDYSKKLDIDRTESAKFIESVLKNTEKSKINMIFDVGNSYVLKYASGILNVAMQSSEYDANTESVPFLQMVLHGNISYASTPQNLSSNSKKEYLDSILLGGASYVCFITGEDALLSNTPYENQWYSLSSIERLNDFIDQTAKLLKMREKTVSESLIGYEKLSDSVSCAEYSNGVKVYVNYGSENASISGMTIPPYGFVLGE